MERKGEPMKALIFVMAVWIPVSLIVALIFGQVAKGN